MQMPNAAVSQPSSAQKLENVTAAVAKIWEQRKPKIIGRVDFLEQATLALLEGKLEEETRREAQREAHKLAGSLTTFGYPEGSRLAREIEQTDLASVPVLKEQTASFGRDPHANIWAWENLDTFLHPLPIYPDRTCFPRILDGRIDQGPVG